MRRVQIEGVEQRNPGENMMAVQVSPDMTKHIMSGLQRFLSQSKRQRGTLT